MFHILLQLWGGVFYLLNKIFFSFAERSPTAQQYRRWRIGAWFVYLIGLPAWVIILAAERNWMVAFVEAGGAPSMLLGLIIALRGAGKEPRWLDHVARVAALLGFCASLYDFGGITTATQVMELGVVVGFLAGTYLLANEHPSGYLWLLLMNGSNAVLMLVEGYPWLCVQQVLSLVFVGDAYLMQRRKIKKLHTAR